MNRQTALTLASRFVDRVKKRGIPVQKALLFGSWAKGTADKNSDIDICVISPKFGKDYPGEMARLLNIAQEVDMRIESVPLNLSDLDDPYSSLAAEIKTTGLPISS